MTRLVGILLAIVIVIGGAWMLSRSRQPLSEVEAARKRVTEALARSQASEYAEAEARALQDSLAVVDSLIAAEQRRFPFLRNYDAILERLRRLEPQVAELEARARHQHDAMASSLDLELARAMETAEAVDEALQSAPTAKGSRLALASMRTDLAAIRERIGAAQAARRNGDIRRAHDLVVDAQARADALLDEILAVKAKVRALRERPDDF